MKEWIGRIALGVSVFGLIGIAAVFWIAYGSLKKSLPILDGETTVTGLRQKVRIERDALGIPTIYAFNPLDQSFAFGFLHGQERFFQMDLYRRIAAGELAEIIPQGLSSDAQVRIHQFRQRAQAIYNTLPEHEKDILKAYTEGVNQGIQQLGSRPFEYHLLQVNPRLWRPEDSILCAVSMTMSLQDTQVLTDRVRGQIAAHLPDSVFDFFYKNGSRWEAPQDGSIRDILPAPDAEAWKAVTDTWPAQPKSANWMPPLSKRSSSYPRETYTNGSNNWAARPKADDPNPGAWVANDMHLSLRIPNTWYRTTIFEQSSSGQPIEVHGVSLPGFPAIIVGSNGKVAWGLTNSNADTEDAVIITPDPNNPDAYLTADGVEPIIKETEVISIKGQPDQALEIEKTRFGPIIATNENGQKIAFQWVAHQDWSVDLELINLAKAETTQEALDIAARSNSPALSFVAGDDQGNIGWTLLGSIPERNTSELLLKPLKSDDPAAIWKGRLPAEEYPRIYNPENGFITTANARVVGGDALRKLGDSGYTMGSRQWKINFELEAQQSDHSLESNLATMMNIESQALYPWQALIRWAYSPTRGSIGEKETALLEQVDRFSKVFSFTLCVFCKWT
ncbi:MAG: penicillin acylase family protein, partial [Opitutales bacterium]